MPTSGGGGASCGDRRRRTPQAAGGPWNWGATQARTGASILTSCMPQPLGCFFRIDSGRCARGMESFRDNSAPASAIA
eukprot:scaffold14794_cov96-Isochrysis_galbana.AAC.3